MQWTNAVLIVDDDWMTADELRVAIKKIGIINVPIAISEHLVSLASKHFSVTHIYMARHIKENPAHPLKQAATHYLPGIPIISYKHGEKIHPELLLPDLCQQFGITNGRTNSK